MIRLAFLMAVLSFSLVHARPANTKETAASLKYLTRYGYLVENDPRTGAIRTGTQQELVDSIKRFQRYSGFKETGVVNDDTLAVMGTDGCGVTDFSKSDRARRKRRYALVGSVWKTNNITYKIKGYTRKLPKSDQRAAFAKAFKIWEAASQLNIRETNDDNADILIDFKRGFHGDGRPFFTTARKVAHAFFPRNNKGISGDVHFNSYIPWTLKSRQGVNLEWVAIHEFGHSLGLGHTHSKENIMYPWYQRYKENYTLSVDDLRGIQALYGKPAHFTTENPTSVPTTQNRKPTRDPYLPDICTTSFDTFFMDAAQKTYAFKGQYYWVIARNAGLESGPHRIVSRWRELRKPVDAAFTRKDGRTVFFTGTQYYIYYYNRLRSGPRHIRYYGLPVALSNMNAVFSWGRNGRTYFFKGDQYWRYDDRKRKTSTGYPRKINGPWKGVPANLDGAMKWRNGRSYFFKGNKFYKIDDRTLTVERNYPKKIGLGWMKCSKTVTRKRYGT